MHQANLGQGVQSPPPQPAAPAPSTPHMPPAYAQERLSSSNPYSRSPLQQPGTREHPPTVETLFTLCRTMDPSVPDARSVHFLIFPDVKEEYLPMTRSSLVSALSRIIPASIVPPPLSPGPQPEDIYLPLANLISGVGPTLHATSL
ncbi:hypothetical protein EDB19DRAFT_1920083 [Suillus lakei]|nr:hypothetical protein EDB19DRAFT_1920083 [Suillus lakei]